MSSSTASITCASSTAASVAPSPSARPRRAVAVRRADRSPATGHAAALPPASGQLGPGRGPAGVDARRGDREACAAPPAGLLGDRARRGADGGLLLDGPPP